MDGPGDEPRGGGIGGGKLSESGRTITSRLPEVKTLGNAQVSIKRADNGAPILGTVSLPDGGLNLEGLIDVEPGAKVVLTAQRDDEAYAQVIEMLEL